jgi:hypothetical protein
MRFISVNMPNGSTNEETFNRSFLHVRFALLAMPRYDEVFSWPLNLLLCFFSFRTKSKSCDLQLFLTACLTLQNIESKQNKIRHSRLHCGTESRSSASINPLQSNEISCKIIQSEKIFVLFDTFVFRVFFMVVCRFQHEKCTHIGFDIEKNWKFAFVLGREGKNEAENVVEQWGQKNVSDWLTYF